MVAWRRPWRLLFGFLAILVLAGLVAAPALAVEFRRGDVVRIPADEVVDDDLFISGSTVVVDGTVNGDLWIAGSDVEVNGTVGGSLFLAGQALELNGEVTGSLYAAGSAVSLGPEAGVGRNLYFAGNALRAGPGSVVGRDLLAAGSQAVIEGRAARNLGFAGNALEIQGQVGGDVDANVAEPGAAAPWPPFAGPQAPPPIPPGIRVSPQARIGGTLTYRSTVEQSENIRSQPAGGVVFRPERRPERVQDPALRWLIGWARLFVTLLALGALAIWGLGAPIEALAGRVYRTAALSAGWGVLISLAGFAAAIVAFWLILIVGGLLAAATLGGLAATVLIGAGSAWAFGFAVFLLALLFGSRIVVSYLLGTLILRRLAGREEVETVWLLLVGALVYSLLQSIPFLGGAIGLAAVLVGLGAIYLVWRDSQARPPA